MQPPGTDDTGDLGAYHPQLFHLESPSPGGRLWTQPSVACAPSWRRRLQPRSRAAFAPVIGGREGDADGGGGDGAKNSRGGYGPLKHSFSKPQTQTGSRGDPTVFSFGVTMTGEEPVDRSSRHGSDGCLHCSGASGPGLLGPGDRAAAGRAGRRRRGGGRRVAGGRGGGASRPGL